MEKYEAKYIDRLALTKNLCKAICGRDAGLCVADPKDCSWKEMRAVFDTPVSDVAPVRHGSWIKREGPDKNMNVTDVCSECGHTDTHSPTVKVPHCWFCGAEMAEYKEEKK